MDSMNASFALAVHYLCEMGKAILDDIEAAIRSD